MLDCERIEPTRVTKVGWRAITTKTFRLPDGAEGPFDVVYPDGQEFANVIAITADNEVVIARQFRPGPEKIMDELPGGYVDEGETPQEAVERELLEETGYKAGAIEYLGAFHKDTYMNAMWHAFLATNCQKASEPEAEAHEHIELATISIEQLLYNATHDKITDHASVIMAYEKLKQLQKEGHNETTN